MALTADDLVGVDLVNGQELSELANVDTSLGKRTRVFLLLLTGGRRRGTVSSTCVGRMNDFCTRVHCTSMQIKNNKASMMQRWLGKSVVVQRTAHINQTWGRVHFYEYEYIGN